MDTTPKDVSQKLNHKSTNGNPRNALVVVLGDLARSPRMQYHCVSLARNNYKVTVIGQYSGAQCCKDLESKDIKQILLSGPPDLNGYMPSSLTYIVKPIWQSMLLLYSLVSLLITGNRPSVILMQNPPTIPTMPILVIYNILVCSKLVIDWHNYGYSILSLKLKSNNIFVRLSRWVEFFFGRYADAGFCVSDAMKNDLISKHRIRYPIQVLYDRPPDQFKPMTLRNKHKFFMKLKKTIKTFKSPFEDMNHEELARCASPLDRSGTRFTIHDLINKNVIMYRPNKPAIIFSSTSWTEDENFSILLEALKMYDNARTSQLLNEDFITNNDETFLPYLVCVITGKGPLKGHYEYKIKNHYKFQHVEIILPWLSSEDYPKMVGCADLGISLHNSSSGLCLPMKVVDMFGCSVPVLAYRYDTINELVIENFYGKTFKDQYDLFIKLVELLQGFYKDDNGPGNNGDSFTSTLSVYRKNISRHFLMSRWEDNWSKKAKPLLNKLT